MEKSLSHFEHLTDNLLDIVIKYGIKILTAIVILIIGNWIANRITRSIRKIMEVRKIDPTLRSFIASFLNIVMKILIVVIVLTTVGVQMTSIVAILGAASLAIGMALSGTLQNFAGGIVILLFKPFKVGDVIQTATGRMGTIEKILIFTTEMHTADKQVIYLPNGALSNGEIINLSRQKSRKVDIVVSIAYGDDVSVARAIALKIMEADKRVLKNPAPEVIIKNLASSSVDLILRYWIKFEDYYSTQADFLEKVYEQFPKNNLHFPFPQMDVRVTK